MFLHPKHGLIRDYTPEQFAKLHEHECFASLSFRRLRSIYAHLATGKPVWSYPYCPVTRQEAAFILTHPKAIGITGDNHDC